MTAPLVDVLVPTCNRPYALAMTLTALAAQSMEAMRIIVSDQSDVDGVFGQPEVLAVLRLLSASGRPVEVLRHMPRLGMAEHRAFLLSLVAAPCCLFLDDDVLVEPDLVARMHRMLALQQCGFVGSAVHGLSYLAARRPHEQGIAFWDGRVEPETVRPGSPEWERHHLHSAANLFHVQQQCGLDRDHQRAYRIAWVGGCVLFDSEKLRAAGGFDFWPQLPAEHCGEDVLAQLRVMAQFGGCGLIPSGAYHMELPTTVTARKVDAPKVLMAQPACVCVVERDHGLNVAARRGNGSDGTDVMAMRCEDGNDGTEVMATRDEEGGDGTDVVATRHEEGHDGADILELQHEEGHDGTDILEMRHEEGNDGVDILELRHEGGNDGTDILEMRHEDGDDGLGDTPVRERPGRPGNTLACERAGSSGGTLDLDCATGPGQCGEHLVGKGDMSCACLGEVAGESERNRR